tara:strand:- start:370 stop:576 length:207 start_codon:yes stop_codon:yes gene_type:complete
MLNLTEFAFRQRKAEESVAKYNKARIKDAREQAISRLAERIRNSGDFDDNEGTLYQMLDLIEDLIQRG